MRDHAQRAARLNDSHGKLWILHGMPSEDALCSTHKAAEIDEMNVKSITQLLAWHADH